MNSHIIKLAETEEEKLGTYRIRFQCLTLEMGDSLYANYEEETFKDKLDEAGKSKIFIAKDPQTNEVVATQRITFRKEIEFTADYLYDYNSIAVIGLTLLFDLRIQIWTYFLDLRSLVCAQIYFFLGILFHLQ